MHCSVNLELQVPETTQVERLAAVLADIDEVVNHKVLDQLEEYDHMKLVIPQLDFAK